MPLIIPANSAVSGGFDVANSLRTDRGSSDYLSRTNGSAGNRRTFTISFWIKKTLLTNSPYMFGTSTSTTNIIDIYNSSDSSLSLEAYTGSWTVRLHSDPLLRDMSAWYHICYAIDTTQSTDTNRVKLYINGVQTTFDTSKNRVFPSQNLELPYNQNSGGVRINCIANYNTEFMSAYYSEFCMIDGSALAPTSFGEFDEDSGIWKPIKISGLTFGNNGFHLEFKQAGTGTNASGMGADTSGEDNHFAVNNLTAVDQSTDTCTNNFATLNPLFAPPAGTPVYSDGNLTSISDGSAAEYGFAGATTIGVTSGKWYCEGKCTLGGSYSRGSIGVTYDPSQSAYKNGGNNPSGKFAYGWSYLSENGILKHNNNTVWDGNAYTTGDIIGIYLDLDNHKLYISKNGTLENSGTGADLTTGETYHIFNEDVTGTTSTSKFQFNFGSPSYAISSSNSDPNGYGSFEYSTTITGDSASKDFYAINSKNLAEYG